jgi:hypothetical protein
MGPTWLGHENKLLTAKNNQASIGSVNVANMANILACCV